MKKFTCHLFLFCLCLSISSCAQKETSKSKEKDKKHAYTNALINESSPYLLQHAHNPVNWYPWGEEALAKAKKEDKMIIISVGYAACHWCHVMEHESFEDTLVANLMNEHFVCIKVDREERPDVDQIYMAACQMINKSGGWPLNAIALPDGKPFFAGTYYPNKDWQKVLNHFINFYKDADNRAKLVEAADQVTQGVAQTGRVGLNPTPPIYTIEKLDKAFDLWSTKIDFANGGFQRANKFPMPASWDYVLQYNAQQPNERAYEALQTTLKNMAYGGIYDHLGGGFARYSTDQVWKVPHFEKMLYDNSQLVSLYAQAYLQNKNPLYKKVVYETLEWIEREMTSKEGGFYSSLDADSEGEEGKFYVWTAAEIKTALGDDASLFMDYYNCTEMGNWEHKNNILLRKSDDEKMSKKYELTIPQLQEKIAHSKAQLMKVRDQRVRPGLDDKVLTSWNALMLSGYVKAYRAFGDIKFLNAALKNAKFIDDKILTEENKITRNYKDGQAVISGFLDDYAFLASAFIDLYQVTFDEKWLKKAKNLTDHCLEHFFDEASGMFHYAPDYNANLIARKMEVTDNVIPASNSEMAHVLYELSLYYYDKNYADKSAQMLSNVSESLLAEIAFFPNWATLMLQQIEAPYEVAIVGKNYDKLRKELDQHYLPKVILMGGKDEGTLELLEGKAIEGQTTIYVCRNKACKRPVTSVKEALELMKN